MKRLTLLRHAKSSWDDPGSHDFDRPLNARGARAAVAMGAEIGRRGLTFDRVLASPARRVTETLAGVEQGLGRSLTARIEPAIYEASPGRLLGLVAALADDTADVLIVGHQPALQLLLLHISEDDGQEFRRRAATKYPTAALAVIELPIARWTDAGRAAGSVTLFVTPRELLP